jgi:anti-sigma factor RsiW
VIPRARHLLEERLFDFYMAERSGDAMDPPVAEHLADCGSCAARYADLVAFMDTLRGAGDAEADALFTPERLRAQQEQIARRIELVGRNARVLSFPSRIVRRTINVSTSRTAPRWIAAAAAAGLFIGVALGASYQFQWGNPGMRRGQPLLVRDAGAQRLSRVVPAATRGTGQPEAATDDAFLSDLEVALERPHTTELLAFDALTPHVREIRDRR